MSERNAFRNGVAEWLMLKNPLYMGRIIQDVKRSGDAFLVEEANGEQTRTWLALNFIDDVEIDEGVSTIFTSILRGRHKLVGKFNQLKYAEDFYNSLDRSKVQDILGQGFSPLGSQRIQLSGDSEVGATSAWLVLSPWGKVWISRMALLCLALEQMDNFTPSDILTNESFSTQDLPRLMSMASTEGKSMRDANNSNVSKPNSRSFRTDALESEASQRFAHLYGLEKYAVRGDSLWDADQIGKTLGRTFITGTVAAITGGGVAGGLIGYATSLADQFFEQQKYLSSNFAAKAKVQADDLYQAAARITEVAARTKDPAAINMAAKLRDAADDFRKSIPLRFENKNLDPKSLYNGDEKALQQRYRQTLAQTKSSAPTAPDSKEHIGIATDGEPAGPNLDRLPESLALGAKSALSNGKGWGSIFAPQVSQFAEHMYATHGLGGESAVLESTTEEMRDILAELRLLAQESDIAKTTTGLSGEMKRATDMMNSYIMRFRQIVKKLSGTDNSKLENQVNLNSLPIEQSVYPANHQH